MLSDDQGWGDVGYNGHTELQTPHLDRMARVGRFVRTIGLARATTKIGLANLVTNLRRLLWLQRSPAPA